MSMLKLKKRLTISENDPFRTIFLKAQANNMIKIEEDNDLDSYYSEYDESESENSKRPERPANNRPVDWKTD